jgi:hypothetical protein
MEDYTKWDYVFGRPVVEALNWLIMTKEKNDIRQELAKRR